MGSSNKAMKLASHGKLTIPHNLRKQLDLKPGDKGFFTLRQDGTLTLRFEQKPSEER
ncbi:hypothetical protein ACNPPY_12830 [Achromobacter sp. AGC78]